MEEKRTLRARMRDALGQLESEWLHEARAGMEERLCGFMGEFAPGMVVAFIPGADEPTLDSVFAMLRKGSTPLGLVRMEDNGGLGVRLWNGSMGSLEVASLGVRQPRAESAQVTEFPPRTLVLVPGLAFGPGGTRLGKGKGYYDRFICSIEKATLVGDKPFFLGVGFACQYTSDIPMTDTDRSLDGWLLGAPGHTMVYWGKHKNEVGIWDR